MALTQQEFVELAGTIVGGGVAGVMGAMVFWKKVSRAFASDNKEIARDKAETNLVDTLNVQIKRLADQVPELSMNNRELHRQVSELRSENGLLTTEIMALRAQIAKLAPPQ